MRRLGRPLFVLMVLSLAVIPFPVHADVCRGELPPLDSADLPLESKSTNRAMLRGQVELGIRHANLGMAALKALSFEVAVKNIRLSYYNLRFAGSGVELAIQGGRNRRFVDPILELADTAIQAAMEHIRYALTAAQGCNAASAAVGLERLENAIANAREAENLL